MSRPPLKPITGPILEVHDLSVTFPGARKGLKRQPFRAVDGVSLRIDAGTTLGLVGESGSGKTTLLKTIVGIYTPTSGEVICRGIPISRLSGNDRKPYRREIQIVFQDPYSSLNPKMTVEDIIAEPLRIMRCYDPTAVADAMEAVGLPRSLGRKKPGEFSGGQRQRVGIARALASRPSMIVLDEPVSALDVSIQAQVLNLLKDIQDETGVAYLLVAHDLSVVRLMAEHIAVMQHGVIVEVNDRASIFQRPQSAYTRRLIDSIPVPDPRRRPASRTRTPRRIEAIAT